MSGLLTIGRWVRQRGATTPARVAIDAGDRLVTYGELDARSERRAAELVAMGLGRGDRVASLCESTPEHVELLFACAKTGVALMPLNWRLAPAELAFQLDDAEPAALFVEEGQGGLARDALAEAHHAPLLEPLERELPEDDALAAQVSDDDPLLLVYTSGTTGKPKGALLTHANCFWTNLGFDLRTGVDGDDVVLQVLPQFHVGGWNVQPLLAWWKGATVILERRFDAARCLQLIADKRVTTMMGVPATYLFMANEPAFADTDLSSLRVAVVGGAPMPEPLLETWHARGIAVVQGYGLTEAAPNVLCLPPEDAIRKLGSAGKPYPYVKVALRDVASGRLLEGEARGELVVKGPNVFAGYWRNPEATAAAFDDGWLLTGDVAERDGEGYYRICGRLKEMFITGGENVYPAEVEDVLLAHDDVADAAVVGVPDERWGEVGVAFVVLRPGAAAGVDELVAHCRSRLAAYKVPRSVRLVPELPRSAMNKVLKGDLVAAWTAEVAS